MAYYSGQAASYQELMDVLVSACVDQGWAWANSILSKGSAYLKIFNQGGDYPGVVAQGGTGKTGSSLINPSSSMPRLGRPAFLGQGQNSNVTWPAQYYIHIFSEPDEVYLVLHHSVDAFWKLSFGVSNFNGSGLWISGTAGMQGPTQSPHAEGSFSPLLNGTGNDFLSTGVPFWQTQCPSNEYVENIVYRDSSWLNSGWTFYAVSAIAPFFSRQPNNWNQESIFFPIRAFEIVASNKVCLRLELNNARYCRIDNLEPNQILNFGNEKWKVYPGVRKNISARNGGRTDLGYDHSGTFGLAIRYDGP
ncbi:hypothetical protein [Acinetobacter ursingii]|uniref:hypothetical protein n=1 Tax=Acinetobacter ursingii TaxID=108980 RepID=UPI00300860CF